MPCLPVYRAVAAGRFVGLGVRGPAPVRGRGRARRRRPDRVAQQPVAAPGPRGSRTARSRSQLPAARRAGPRCRPPAVRSPGRARRRLLCAAHARPRPHLSRPRMRFVPRTSWARCGSSRPRWPMAAEHSRFASAAKSHSSWAVPGRDLTAPTARPPAGNPLTASATRGRSRWHGMAASKGPNGCRRWTLASADVPSCRASR